MADACVDCGDTNWGIRKTDSLVGGKGVTVECMTCLGRASLSDAQPTPADSTIGPEGGS